MSTRMDEQARAVPADLDASWQRSTADPDPVSALGATRDLARRVDRWQGTLVREALRGGATWEQIGDTLGTSRQAAWARFRDVVDQGGRGKVEDRTAELRARIHDEVRSMRESMRAMEEEHRKARADALQQIREMDRKAREQRHELKERMKKTIRSLQDELRALRSA